MTVMVGELVVSGHELLFLAGLGAIEPLVPVVVAPLDDAAWEAVAAGLLAKGVLEPDPDDDGCRVAESLRPLLGVAFLATRSTRSSWAGDGRSAASTVLQAGEVAVLHEIGDDGLHRLRAFDPADAEALHRDLLRLDSFTEHAVSVAPATIDLLLELSSQPGAVVRSFETTERASADDEPQSRRALLVEGSEGLWLAESVAGAEPVVRPVDAVEAQATLVAAIVSAS